MQGSNKKPDTQNEERQIVVTNIPLTILVSAAINSSDAFHWIFKAAEALVVFVLTYQIIGKTLFVALVITPMLVFFIESCFDCWSVLNESDGDDWDGSDDDNDSGFGDHWNNLTKK